MTLKENQKDLIKFLADFKGKRIGVLGDLMLDQYILGDVERISPEAPVPVLVVGKEFFVPGGAGNVAANIAALGGKVFVSGAIGKDEAGNILINKFKAKNIDTGGVIKIANSPTTQKVRILARGQQLVRIDRENNLDIVTEIKKKIVSFVSKYIRDWDGLVISDYAKGFVSKNLTQAVINLARRYKKPVIGDTKPKHAHYFKNVTLLAPNHKEAVEIAGNEDIKKAGKIIQKKLNCSVLITQGPQGMSLFEKNKVEWFPAKAKEVFDVTGAGDTVTAILALCLASGLNLRAATIMANHAAGIVVAKRGTATVSIEELIYDLKNNN